MRIKNYWQIGLLQFVHCLKLAINGQGLKDVENDNVYTTEEVKDKLKKWSKQFPSNVNSLDRKNNTFKHELLT